VLLQELVQIEVQRWASKGINIKYETRPNRKGYKAGALRQGMKWPYVATCDYVAIFDADFQPESDFLMRTVPFLVHNPKLGLVQARWKFGKHHLFGIHNFPPVSSLCRSQTPFQ
jgi:beta-mannan synthase